MATYLVLSNRVLNALNEVEMTSANLVVVVEYKLLLKTLLIGRYMMYIMN